ncbi:MAG TPA: polysaccharide biosynthesis/export family protein [Candidatus Acidoferrales bacterium]|nr:polysaccharide biosynthesis/export family protein [Candidatus Acidoferrales bacterium]
MQKIELWIVLLLLLLAMPAVAQEGGKTNSQNSAAASANGSAQKTGTDSNYIIGPQDVLDISVWKEDQLTKTVPVRPDGKISLPLLNDVQAAGFTPTQLAAHITESLKKFVTDPQVTVIVREINSQRVYLLGEVNRAGAYPLLPGMTVLQALSSGGGFTQFANTKKIYVLRVQNGKQEKYPFNYKNVINGKQPDQNILLRAGDTIVVP